MPAEWTMLHVTDMTSERMFLESSVQIEELESDTDAVFYSTPSLSESDA